MRTSTLVVVTFLGLQLAQPALAQSSSWDFSAKAPIAADAATPNGTAIASRESAIAPKQIAVAKKS